jgi:hypothetical protein
MCIMDWGYPLGLYTDSLKGVVDLVSRDMVGGPCARGGLVRFGLGGDFIDF